MSAISGTNHSKCKAEINEQIGLTSGVAAQQLFQYNHDSPLHYQMRQLLCITCCCIQPKEWTAMLPVGSKALWEQAIRAWAPCALSLWKGNRFRHWWIMIVSNPCTSIDDVLPDQPCGETDDIYTRIPTTCPQPFHIFKAPVGLIAACAWVLKRAWCSLESDKCLWSVISSCEVW